MDKPATYAGGPETLFRRAESSAFFGREIGLMYVHAHLRYCEALALEARPRRSGRRSALVNPIAVTERLPQASLRQRNTYFSSSDAAFHDRYRRAPNGSGSRRERSPSTAAGASIQAAPGSTPEASSKISSASNGASADANANRFCPRSTPRSICKPTTPPGFG